MVSAIGAEPYVEVVAEIESTTYQKSEQPHDSPVIQSQRRFSVACIVGKGEWRIDNDFLVGGEERWYFDGTNVYHSIRRTSPEDAAMLTNRRKFGIPPVPFAQASTNVTIYVENGLHGHPLGNIGVNIPWLAFCSAEYLQRPGRLVPIPIADLRHAADGLAYRDQTVCFDGTVSLPESVSLFTSLKMFHVSINMPHFVGSHDAAAYLQSRGTNQDDLPLPSHGVEG